MFIGLKLPQQQTVAKVSEPHSFLNGGSCFGTPSKHSLQAIVKPITKLLKPMTFHT